VFGTTLGLVLQASPSTYQGAQITEDANAFALSVSSFGEAKVVSRVNVASGQPTLFLNTLPSSTVLAASQFSGATPVPGGAGAVGAPSVAVDEQGEYRIAFTSGAAAELLSGGEFSPATPEVALGPEADSAGAGAATALNPAGGGVSAWPSAGGVAVREDFPNGAAQAALVSGLVQGSVSQLDVAGSESGEGVVGFREGDPGAQEIVGERVSVPPPSVQMEMPIGWVRPSNASFAWSDAEDAAGGVTYSVLIDGHVARAGLHSREVLLDRRLLGSGVRNIQVLATDASGQQSLSGVGKLRVDGSPPVASVRRGRGATVIVRVKDAQSGAVASDTLISFGDGTSAKRKLTASHTYAHGGRYTITVRMRDRVGNEATAHLRVSVQ
jgi:hypothetical protein